MWQPFTETQVETSGQCHGYRCQCGVSKGAFTVPTRMKMCTFVSNEFRFGNDEILPRVLDVDMNVNH